MFAVYYTSPQAMTAFTALYKNTNGLQDKFVDYWDITSATLTKNPYVVGFDPLNEPYPGNFIRSPHLLWPGKADSSLLAPMYTRIFEKYMQNDQESIMWFEPTMFPDVFGAGPVFTVFPVGFDIPPGGQIGSRNHVLNDHSYCCSIGGVCKTGEPTTDVAAKCLAFHEERLSMRSKDAERLGLPLVITEFGACLTELPCT